MAGLIVFSLDCVSGEKKSVKVTVKVNMNVNMNVIAYVSLHNDNIVTNTTIQIMKTQIGLKK